MRPFKTGIFLIVLLLALYTKAQQQDGSVLEKKITISAEKQPLGSILDQVSWQSRIFFSYDASQIDGGKKVTVKALDKSLYMVLSQLFDPEKYSFRELENQVIISRKDETVVKNDTIPVKYVFLSGRIVDEKKEDPVAYASVSLLNKPVGTISNIDGDYLLKLHPDQLTDTVVVSCMGYSRYKIPGYRLLDEEIIYLAPASIRIKEIKVTSTTPQKLLANIRNNLDKNYSSYSRLMTAFYRETIRQDGEYIDISEAVIEILKAPYDNAFKSDVVRIVKGRQSPDVKNFNWFNFKLQGGPYTITKLDVVKTVESFISKEYENQYKYNISNVIWYNENPVYVLNFQPVSGATYPTYSGEIYVHRETFAIVHVNFRLNKAGLKEAANVLIKRKPNYVRARPSVVEYKINYQQYLGKWHLKTAQASIKIRLRSKRDGVNSEFHSISDLLITNIESTDIKKFTRKEAFLPGDIFVEMINEYDPAFWENYNIIKPDEDLKNAFKNFSLSLE